MRRFKICSAFVVLCFVQTSVGKVTEQEHGPNCTTKGPCQKCPPKDASKEYCQTTGYRQKTICVELSGDKTGKAETNKTETKWKSCKLEDKPRKQPPEVPLQPPMQFDNRRSAFVRFELLVSILGVLAWILVIRRKH